MRFLEEEKEDDKEEDEDEDEDEEEEPRLDCLIRSARLPLKSSPSCIFVSGSSIFSSSGKCRGEFFGKGEFGGI